MYRYDEFDQEFVKGRVAQFTDQVERRLAGEITEDQFRPLRLMNGVYLDPFGFQQEIEDGLTDRVTRNKGRRNR